MTSERGCGTRFPRLVERAFIGDLPRWRRRALDRHLSTCVACRDHYDRLARVDQLLGNHAPLSAAAIARIESEVIAAGTAHPRRRAMWVGVGAAATAAILLLFFMRRRDDREDLRPRGGDGARERTPGVRLFCVAADRDDVLAESRVVAVAGPIPTLRCNLGAELQLAYSTPNLEGLTMVAFGVPTGGGGEAVLFYAPPSGDEDAVPLAADRIDEPLPWSTRLGVNHEVGEYGVVVRVFDRPLSAADAVAGIVTPVVELRGRIDLQPGGRP